MLKWVAGAALCACAALTATGHGQPAHRQVAEVPTRLPSYSGGQIDGLQAIPGMRAPTQPSRLRALRIPRPAAPVAAPSSKRAFIRAIAPGAIAGERQYGVPASVTIAQAILESDWGLSKLSARWHNPFGMKGEGSAGSVVLQTEEFINGQYVSEDAPFRVYANISQAIQDHDRLLAYSGYYLRAMALRRNPNAFADALTGVYATAPYYGRSLRRLMRRYNLYRFDVSQRRTRTRRLHRHRTPHVIVGDPIPGLAPLRQKSEHQPDPT